MENGYEEGCTRGGGVSYAETNVYGYMPTGIAVVTLDKKEVEYSFLKGKNRESQENHTNPKTASSQSQRPGVFGLKWKSRLLRSVWRP
jgi:hypothetical protein